MRRMVSGKNVMYVKNIMKGKNMNEKYRILSTVSIYHALNDGSVSTIPLLFPIFKSLFDLNYTQVGIISGGGLLITLIAQLLIGRTADGRNFGDLLSIGVLLTSVSLLLLTRSQSFLMLALFIFILRFSTSFFHPIGVGWISRTFKKDRLDWAMGIQSGSADFGAFVAIATTLFLAENRNWNFPLYIWAIIGIIGLLTSISLLRKVDKNLIIVKTKNKKQNLREALQETINLMKRIKLLVPAIMISGSAWGVVITYLPLLMDEKTTLSLSTIGFIVAIWIGIGSIVSFFYGKISSILGRKNVIILSYLSIGILGISLSYFTNVIIILVIMVLLGLSLFMTYPAQFSFISEVTHESVESRTFGIIFTLQLGGGTVILLLGGILSDIFGIWIPFAFLGILSLLLTIALITNYKKPLVGT